MNTDSLRAFVAAAKYHSLTLAAKELRLSQPAISKQLKTLQERLKVQLYQRNGHGIKVTPSGELLLKNAKPILDQLQKLPGLIARSRSQAPALPQRLRVAGSFMLSTIVLPELLARFQQCHPDVELELVTASPEQVAAQVLDSDAELGLSTQKPRSRKFHCERFRRESLVFFVAATHPLARKRRVTLLDLRTSPIIARDDIVKRDGASAVLNQLKQTDLAVNVGQHFSSPVAVKSAVGRNLGVGLLFKDTVERAVNNGVFKILRGHGLKLEGTSYILRPKSRKLSPLAQEFLALLRKASKSNGRLPRLATARPCRELRKH